MMLNNTFSDYMTWFVWFMGEKKTRQGTKTTPVSGKLNTGFQTFSRLCSCGTSNAA